MIGFPWPLWLPSLAARNARRSGETGKTGMSWDGRRNGRLADLANVGRRLSRVWLKWSLWLQHQLQADSKGKRMPQDLPSVVGDAVGKVDENDSGA